MSQLFFLGCVPGQLGMHDVTLALHTCQGCIPLWVTRMITEKKDFWCRWERFAFFRRRGNIFLAFPVKAFVAEHIEDDTKKAITAFTSQRTNLSPFTKGCREWDASM